MAIAVALLVSVDSDAVQHFTQVLPQLSLASDVCRSASEAIHLLHRRKYDAVIVDLHLGKQAGMVLDEACISASNRTAVTFAISSNGTELDSVLRRQTAFVFERPLSTQSIHATLKPAYGLILRERRRYFRCPLAIPVLIRRRGMDDVHCYSVNISEGGMALSTFVPFKLADCVQVEFTLPGHQMPIVAASAICWWKSGHLGVHFVTVSDEQKSQLQNWLAGKLEEILPEFVAQKFSANGSAHLSRELTTKSS